MSYDNLYKTLADNFNNYRYFPPEAPTYLLNAVNAVINFTTDDDSDATKIVNKLLYTVYYAYVGVKKRYDNEVQVVLAVRSINDYIIYNSRYGDGDATYLTTFVNNLWGNDISTGELSCVPLYWVVLSEEAGYDVTHWNVCS